ncbi:MAG: PfkB family carbohydrate kinase [Phycisphaeraceae bacterium]
MFDEFTIVGIGEALFDVYPGGQRVGGAPLNVAVMAHQLAGPHGGRGVVVSRVGQDRLGQRLIDELRGRGVVTEYIQTDPDRPTGRVFIEFGADGQPRYEVATNVAWDVLSYDFDGEDLAMTCAAVAFGTLAQRDAQARNSIYRFLDTARQAERLFDVNLREPLPDHRTIRRSCERATILKLNTQELEVVARMLAIERPAAGGDEDAGCDELVAGLLRMFKFELVVLTRGERGTVIYERGGGRCEGAAARFEPEQGATPVGAGDACSAAVLVGRVLQWPTQRIADVANRVGALVAARAEATPELEELATDGT